MFALLILSIPYFLQNPLRPLIGADNIFVKERVSQYFANRPEHFAAYNDQAQKIDNLACADIGFMADIDDYEYPIWAITKAYGKDIHLEHIFVDNLSGSLNTEFIPCAIVSTYPIKEQTIAYQNILFGKFNEKEQISLFVPLNP